MTFRRSGGREHLSLVSSLRGKVSVFSPLGMILAVSSFVDFFFNQIEPVLLYSCLLRVFIMKCVLGVVRFFFCIYCYDRMIFLLQLADGHFFCSNHFVVVAHRRLYMGQKLLDLK